MREESDENDGGSKIGTTGSLKSKIYSHGSFSWVVKRPCLCMPYDSSARSIHIVDVHEQRGK
jgi:hypothetical protein